MRFDHLSPCLTRFAAGIAIVIAVGSGASVAWSQDTKTAPATPTTTATSGSSEFAASTPVHNADPVLDAALARLGDKTFVARARKDDVAAAIAYYSERSEPIWLGGDGINAKARAVIGEMRKAEEWGLDPRAFSVPDPSEVPATPAAKGEAEARITLAALTYARHARGGRLDISSLSRIIDLSPPIKDPKDVLSALGASAEPDAFLRDLHPKHVQFVRLRQALLKALGPTPKAKPVEPALLVKLPSGSNVKPGALHPDISLLRKRLKQPAPFAGRETFYDDDLVAAITTYQKDKGLKANGVLSDRTVRALNSEGEPKKPEGGSNTQRLVINMERWRWMPEKLGSFHVWNNIPEYVTRTMKDDREVFKERIIVGLPTWPTPVFSADMKTIEFNPSWGVPDGIKQKELLPRLQKAGGGGFFDQLFGGGGGGGSVIRAYGLTPYINGKPVDPDSVNWASADLRKYSFIQPPGGKNPLGMVKFLFPNSHDVYMHDTIQRDLFASSQRAYSHGCIRVQNPRRFAEVLIAEDRGVGMEKAASIAAGSGTIKLDRPFPVHITYITAVVDDSGRVSTFGDVYGHDSRLSQALGGRVLRDDADIETASVDAEDDVMADGDQPTVKKKKNTEQKQKSKPSKYAVPRDIADTMSGLAAN